MLMLILLHLLPPETAHALTIFGLKLGLGPRLKNKSDLRFKLFGKEIRNPIGLSGGADKEAAALPAWSKMGFGLVEAGTVTLHPRTGNPKPRMWRLPNYGVINWLGLPGRGLNPFLKNLKRFKKHPARGNLCVGASIASPDGILDEFQTLARAVAPYVDYITLNASCPNVAHDDDMLKDGDGRPASLCERSLAASEQLIDTAAAQIKAAKLGAGRTPVLVKLGPTHDATALERMVRATLAAGVDGFVATNTVPFASRTLLPRMTFEWPKHDGKEVGGYSGTQLLQTAAWMVKEIRRHIPAEMPIIGVGGIQKGEDAVLMLKSGANAIQLYTGLIYHGPDLLNEIATALKR